MAMNTDTDTEPHRCTAISTTTGQRCKRRDLVGRYYALSKNDPPGTLCSVHWHAMKQKMRPRTKATR